MTANIGSYIYHLLMGRLLGPAGYGEFSSLLSILYIFTVPLIVGQTVLVKFISGFKAHGEIGQAKSLFINVTKLCILMSLMGFPICCSTISLGYFVSSSFFDSSICFGLSSICIFSSYRSYSRDDTGISEVSLV